MPDVLIPQAGSRFFQTTDIEIASGAVCLLTELVAPGRLARGERFAYSTLDLRTHVIHEGRTVIADTLVLEPQLRPPGQRGLMGKHLFVGSALALAPSGDTAALLGVVDSACARSSSLAVIAGCSLPGNVGVGVRALQNIVNAVVPKQELLEAQIKLILAHFEHDGLLDAGRLPGMSLSEEHDQVQGKDHWCDDGGQG
jgi:urease accessory protein